MAARLIPARELLRLTQENHPENAVPKATPKLPTVTLFSMIAISAFCGLVGMTFGAAMLSTAFLADGMGEVVCLIPLVIAAVGLLSGWVGAFFWMVREESQKGESGKP
jgi:H+/Cl- antiporter ClcA